MLNKYSTCPIYGVIEINLIVKKIKCKLTLSHAFCDAMKAGKSMRTNDKNAF